MRVLFREYYFVPIAHGLSHAEQVVPYFGTCLDLHGGYLSPWQLTVKPAYFGERDGAPTCNHDASLIGDHITKRSPGAHKVQRGSTVDEKGDGSITAVFLHSTAFSGHETDI